MIGIKKNQTTGILLRGRVIGFDQHGAIVVEPIEGGVPVSCYCIRNSETEQLTYAINDIVAFSISENRRDGFILGLIEPYFTCTTETAADDSLKLNSDLVVIDHDKQCITLRGKTIALDATDTITITCGKGKITMSKDGAVTVRGTKLLSRSSGSNKIKGAAVLLN